MLIKFLSNGVQQHVENSVGRAMIAGSLAVEVKPPAPVPPTPVWSVRRDPSGYVLIEMKLGCMGAGSPSPNSPRFVATFKGDPDKIHDRKDHTGKLYSSAFGRPVPLQIVNEYRWARQNPDAVRPVSSVTDDYNKDHAEKLARLNQQAYKPVISEHDALEAQDGHNREVAMGATPVSQDGPIFGSGGKDLFDLLNGRK